ncbi:uncharacterized protein E5676_scaffold249G00180 [Cucumis melo var. makuwa]|uniref:Uncharacterized protein n=1 Tax=Cucumis melo var. makuwa TaxID=1194695 RepID=A0A5D3CGB1_CUCMM|nr:uncharacterized protein E5676_scaffold249G00180 [Cucumis melo var. makuwa]
MAETRIEEKMEMFDQEIAGIKELSKMLSGKQQQAILSYINKREGAINDQ